MLLFRCCLLLHCCGVGAVVIELFSKVSLGMCLTGIALLAFCETFLPFLHSFLPFYISIFLAFYSFLPSSSASVFIYCSFFLPSFLDFCLGLFYLLCFFCLSFCFCFVCSFLHSLFVCLSFCLSFLLACFLSLSPSLFALFLSLIFLPLFLCLARYLSFHPPVFLSTCPPVYRFYLVYQSISCYLIYLSIFLSIYQPVSLLI